MRRRSKACFRWSNSTGDIPNCRWCTSGSEVEFEDQRLVFPYRISDDNVVIVKKPLNIPKHEGSPTPQEQIQSTRNFDKPSLVV
mmetsp:Transcript_17194/g.41903  ORF Transcript_17194/g.41903 Transcript_17194/m.41903 type:complete len:84 (-) Transcript_17194:333-584(-)